MVARRASGMLSLLYGQEEYVSMNVRVNNQKVAEVGAEDREYFQKVVRGRAGLGTATEARAGGVGFAYKHFVRRRGEDALSAGAHLALAFIAMWDVLALLRWRSEGGAAPPTEEEEQELPRTASSAAWALAPDKISELVERELLPSAQKHVSHAINILNRKLEADAEMSATKYRFSLLDVLLAATFVLHKPPSIEMR